MFNNCWALIRNVINYLGKMVCDENNSLERSNIILMKLGMFRKAHPSIIPTDPPTFPNRT